MGHNDATPRARRRTILKGSGAAMALGSTALAGCLGDDGEEGPIELWHAMGGDSGDLLDEMIEEFPDADAESEYQGSYEEVLNNLFGAIEAGEMPDVVMIDSLHNQQVLDTESTLPVQEILPDDYPVDDLVDAVSDFFVVDGDLYSMPFNNSNAIMYYNKDMFEEAGLDPEDPPETLEEVREASEAIVDAGVADAGITWPNHIWFVEHFYALADELIVDAQNGHDGAPTTIHTDTPFAEDLWTWWRDMYQDDLFLNPGIEAWDEARSAFLSGEVAMELDSTAAVEGHVSSSEEEGFELGTAFYPSPVDDRTGVPIGGASLFVSGEVSDERAETIGELLGYLGNVENQVRWHKGSGYYSIREEGVDELQDEGWFDENPAFWTAFDQLLESETTPATLRMLVGPAREVQLTVQEKSVEIFSGDADVSEGLEEMQAEVEEQFERYDRVIGE